MNQVAGKDQTLVTGAGGPSGTGKRPIGETVLPPPVFLQEIKAVKSLSDKERKESESPVLDNPLQQDPVDSVEEDEEEQKRSSIHSKFSDRGEAMLSKSDDFPPQASSHFNESGQLSADLRYLEAPTFNGLTLNAVFPVPVSSLKITVWSVVLRENRNSLSSNPFGQLLFPFSELLNLTLPPVDATAIPNFRIYQEEKKNLKVEGSTETSQLWNEVDTLASTIVAKSVDQSSQKVANTSFSALRQLFPGVNLAYGAQLTPTNLSRSVP